MHVKERVEIDRERWRGHKRAAKREIHRAPDEQKVNGKKRSKWFSTIFNGWDLKFSYDWSIWKKIPHSSTHARTTVDGSGIDDKVLLVFIRCNGSNMCGHCGGQQKIPEVRSTQKRTIWLILWWRPVNVKLDESFSQIMQYEHATHE